MPPSSFFSENENVVLQNYEFWLPKPSWGPENVQNRLAETSRGPQNGQNRVPEGPQRRPRSPEGLAKGPQGVNLTPPRPPKSVLGGISGPPRTLRNLQNPYVSLRKSMIFEFGPGAVRRCPQTRPVTQEKDPTGPKFAAWRQGPGPGGKSF